MKLNQRISSAFFIAESLTRQIFEFYSSCVFVFVVSLSYLDNRMKTPVDTRSEDFAPLATYRHSLLMGEADTTVQQSRLAPPTGTTKRGRGAKRKLNVEGLFSF